MEGRPVSYSRLESRFLPQPRESNNSGLMHGGNTLYYLDCYCGMTATRHSGTRVVTVSVDRMDFMSPIRLGEVIVFKTSVNSAQRSSMEVGARIEAENNRSLESRHVGTAYLTFVALNENGRPTQVPSLIPETAEDVRRMADAVRRSYLRRVERAQAKGKAFTFQIDLLPDRFFMCKTAPGMMLPPLPGACFSFNAATPNETTFVLPENTASENLLRGLDLKEGGRIEKGWRAFALRAELDVSISGVVATLTAVLAAEKISLHYVSTFSSGYLLVRGDMATRAAEALRLAGHSVGGA